MVSDYHLIKMRLLNSQELLEGTDLTFFNINETTLVRVIVKSLIIILSFGFYRFPGTRTKQGGMR